MQDDGVIDEAYERLHATGPEFDGWLSNHGPMAAEAMVRLGHASEVQKWLDGYVRRLEPCPRGQSPIGDDWHGALGDARRIGDWTSYFVQLVSERPWRDVLNVWWPRLLPGLAAAATHGVIRVGHAVRTLLHDGDSPTRVTELAHGLAYWAARWQAVPGAKDAFNGGWAVDGTLAPHEVLQHLPRLSPQSGGIRERWDRLGAMTAWPSAAAVLRLPSAPEETEGWLASLVDTAVVNYLWYGHGNSIMMVHSVTAPNAVLRTLPALDRRLWAPSAAASWAAVAALTAVYAPARPADKSALPAPPEGELAHEDVLARAVEQGDEHAIKFVDSALDAYRRTHDRTVLAAAIRAVDMIEEDV